MNENLQEKKVDRPKISIGVEDIVIPQCCVEGWPSCKHVLKPEKKVKRNIGL